jgi:8-oxo-dGTP pyrophosphatase MutT (NUDIX family)
MHRTQLLSKLQRHHGIDEHEETMRRTIIAFVERHADCFDRTLLKGHITGSAFIVDPERTRALLTHHHFLDKWLQLGGHSDGDPDTLAVALRETREESGLTMLAVANEGIFDVDIHPIPERKNEPEHYHYDIRFLVEADPGEPLRITSESKDLAWIPLNRIAEYTKEESLLRMVRKIAAR